MSQMPLPAPHPGQWVQQTTVAQSPLGPSSTHTVCPSCGSSVYSNTTKTATPSAWWSCLVICICGFFCGCCLIPFCMDSCNSVKHTCPKCDSFLGQFKP